MSKCDLAGRSETSVLQMGGGGGGLVSFARQEGRGSIPSSLNFCRREWMGAVENGVISRSLKFPTKKLVPFQQNL